jgi:hypothetical protein
LNDGASSGSKFDDEHPLAEPIEMSLEDLPYYYPYDKKEFGIGVQFSGFYGDGSSAKTQPIPVDVSWKISYLGGELITFVDGPKNDWPSYQIIVDIVRPANYRILAPFLLFLPFFFICLLPFIKDAGAFGQCALAVVFGLWSIRQVLSPGNIRGTTLLDAIITGLYVYLACVALYWLYLRYRAMIDQGNDVSGGMGSMQKPHVLHDVYDGSLPQQATEQMETVSSTQAATNQLTRNDADVKPPVQPAPSPKRKTKAPPTPQKPNSPRRKS